MNATRVALRRFQGPLPAIIKKRSSLSCRHRFIFPNSIAAVGTVPFPTTNLRWTTSIGRSRILSNPIGRRADFVSPYELTFQHRCLSQNSTSEEKEEKQAETETSDPPILTWVDDFVPSAWQPYARLARIDKPIGTWLLLWPCFWSTAMAAPVGHLPDPYLLSLFSVGALVMRGAGCTINDMWDADIDKKVHRTASRPLARGDINHNQALGFLAAQLTVGLGVLVSLPNTLYCFWWGASSLPLVVIYPLMKRYTDWPQLVLGMTFNWGAWMGWAATYGAMDYSIIGPLYVSGVTWTLVYDTIYANQDKEDDSKLGLHSTALTFGEDVSKHKLILNTFATATWASWLLAGYSSADDMASLPLYYSGVTAAYGHLMWQIRTAELDNPHNLAERFRSNTAVGGIIFVSIVAGKMLGA